MKTAYLSYNKRSELARNKLKRKIIIILISFDTSKRKTKYLANLIIYWALIGNLKYNYSKNDSVQETLCKMILILRQIDIQIFNFFVSIDVKPLFIDREFMILAI